MSTQIFVGTVLVDMYTKCERKEDAGQPFDQMPERNAGIAIGRAEAKPVRFLPEFLAHVPPRSSGASQAGYTNDARNGHAEETLKTLFQMSWSIMKPNQFIFAIILKACAWVAADCLTDVVSCNAMITVNVQHGHDEDAVELIRQMHRIAMDPNEYTFTSILWNVMLSMYAKCGSIDIARQVFDKMLERDVVSYNAMFAGYSQHGIVHIGNMASRCIL
eukprot:Gb_10579 [translate_table: standard]